MDRVCQFYLRGRCNRSTCEFKHVKPPEGTGSSSSIYRKTPCRFFEANGSCRFGDNCRFFHDATSSNACLPKPSKLLLDSDDDLPPGMDSDDDDESNVSGFTVLSMLSGKKHPINKRNSERSTRQSKAEEKEDHKKTATEKPSATKNRLNKTETESDTSLISDASLIIPPESPNKSPVKVISKGASPLMVAKKSVPPIIDNAAGNEKPPSSTSTANSNNNNNKKKADASKASLLTTTIVSNTMKEGALEKEHAKECPAPKDKRSASIVVPPSQPTASKIKQLKSIPKPDPKIVEESSTTASSYESCSSSSSSVNQPLAPRKSEGAKAIPPTPKTQPPIPPPQQPPQQQKKDDKSSNITSPSVPSQQTASNVRNSRRSTEIRAAARVQGYEESSDETSEWSSSSCESSDEESSSSDSSPVPERTSIRIRKRLISQVSTKKSAKNNSSASMRCQGCKLKRSPRKNCGRCDKLRKSITTSTPRQTRETTVEEENTTFPKISVTENKDQRNTGPRGIAVVAESKGNTLNPQNKTDLPSSDTSKSKDNNNSNPPVVDVVEHPPTSQPTKTLELPKFDPKKFKPGYVPPIVKKGDEEYAVVVTGVKDTGLCGKYWGDLDNLPPRRKRRPVAGEECEEITQAPLPSRPAKRTDLSPLKVSQQSRTLNNSSKGEAQTRSKRKLVPSSSPPIVPRKSARTSYIQVEQRDNTPEPSNPTPVMTIASPLSNSQIDISITKTTTTSPVKSPQVESKSIETQTDKLLLGPQAPISSDMFAAFNGGSSSSVIPMNKEQFAPYDDNKWFNIGKGHSNSPIDAIQYARSLRLPFHLLSFLRIKGNSIKGSGCTEKNNMVFVVIEGEVSVDVDSRKGTFDAKKGDSFFIPPKSTYNLINAKAREAELCIFQFANEDSIRTIEQNNGVQHAKSSSNTSLN